MMIDAKIKAALPNSFGGRGRDLFECLFITAYLPVNICRVNSRLAFVMVVQQREKGCIGRLLYRLRV